MMTYYVTLDQRFMVDYGLGVKDAFVLSYLRQVAADSTIQGSWIQRRDDGYLWLSSSKLKEQLPAVCTSSRTVERAWKRLRDAGMIETITEDNRHYFRLLAPVIEWGKQVPPKVATPPEGTDKSGGSTTDKSGGRVPPKVAGNNITNNNKAIDKETEGSNPAPAKDQNRPLKGPALSVRIRQPHSDEYLEFLSLLEKSPSRKNHCASMWYQNRAESDQSPWSYQTIWHSHIKPAMIDRIKHCQDWGKGKYAPKPDTVLEERKWENKIVKSDQCQQPQQGRVAVHQQKIGTCVSCNEAPAENIGALHCSTCRERIAVAEFSQRMAEASARKSRANQ